MNAKKLEDLLEDLSACKTPRDWARGKSLLKAYQTCNEPHWIIWLLKEMEGNKGWPNNKNIRLALCDCAAFALAVFEKAYPKDKRLRVILKDSRKYANGKLSSIRADELYSDASYIASELAGEERRAARSVQYTLSDWIDEDVAREAADAIKTNKINPLKAGKIISNIIRKRIKCPKV
jgi:hypothetical protein